MKKQRQEKILELIKSNRIETQEELQQRLIQCGFNVTQATVSRDIRELGIIKYESGDGVYKYRAGNDHSRVEIAEKFKTILGQAITHVAYANNLIVVKTFIGMGSAAGAAIDSMELHGIIGTLAGDDTLLIIAQTNDTAAEITATLNELIK